MTIVYLSKLHPHYTNRENLKNLHNNVLEDIDLDANLAVKLGPSLKAHQMEAITNGNIYTPDIPILKSVDHGWDKDKVTTDIIGIKCAGKKAHLLKRILLSASIPYKLRNKQIGLFILTGS